jgi:hypothetical protein
VSSGSLKIDILILLRASAAKVKTTHIKQTSNTVDELCFVDFSIKKRLRYSLLELCEEEKLRGEENDEAHPNALLQDIILDCQFQTARECGLVYQKCTRKEKEKENSRRHACTKSYCCRRRLVFAMIRVASTFG